MNGEEVRLLTASSRKASRLSAFRPPEWQASWSTSLELRGVLGRLTLATCIQEETAMNHALHSLLF